VSARFLTDDPEGWDDSLNACSGYAIVLYRRGSEMGARVTEASSNEPKRHMVQKRRLEPVGYFCERCDTFMTIDKYQGLVTRVKEKIDRDEAAEERRQAFEYADMVYYHTRKGKPERERYLAEAKAKGDERHMGYCEYNLQYYYGSGPEGQGVYYEYISPEAQQRAEELMSKYQFDENQLRGRRYPVAPPKLKLQYTERLKRSISHEIPPP
jgi:hypothetical protein